MRSLLACLFFVSCFFAAESVVAQKRFIELEVISVGVAELGLQQQVMEMLSNVGADRVTVKSRRADTRAGIVETENDGTTHILVTAILDGRSLRLPGGRFSVRDSDRIKDLVQKLRDDGAQTTFAEKQAFGLTAPQLVGVFEELGREVPHTTKGQPSNQIIRELATGLRSEINVTNQARRLLDGTPVLEEYEGISTGTAMAGILRPLGLVLSPIRPQGGEVSFRIAASSEVDEHWPIGWPIEDAPIDAEPRVFERLDDVGIENFVLQDALNAIEKRLGIPFFYDQNGIARAGVELDQVKVTLIRKRLAYILVLKKILVQTRPKLGLEIRKDENNKSFLWISPLN